MDKEYRVQLETVVERAMQELSLRDIEQEECKASISHWLEHPDATFPFLSETLRNFCEVHAMHLVSRKPRFTSFTFIDLFAGIGGIRSAFSAAGGSCVFSSEWDKYAKETYAYNYGHYPYGDIQRISKEDIPDHDVLCGGFPCQPFSLAGVSKKNSLGRKHGFEDETQGTLFFEIKEILRVKRPKAFFLENVKNLLSHDKGRTFQVVRDVLESQLGYDLHYAIVDGGQWVPQHRERIFLVGFDPAQVITNEFSIPLQPEEGYVRPQLAEILQEQLQGYTLGPGTWDTLKRHRAHHQKAGNGFGYSLHTFPIPEDARTRTISARYHKDGAEILVEQQGDRPRKISLEEGLRLQGFSPETFTFPVSKTQAYRQIGNSVVVPAVHACAKSIQRQLEQHVLPQACNV